MKRVLLPGCPYRPWLAEKPPQGSKSYGNEAKDSRGRVRVWLGRGHRFANSAGYQWRYRLLVMYSLGRTLLTCEHVDHKSGIVDDDRLSELRILDAVYHGSYHAWISETAGYRGADGRFVEHDEPLAVTLASRLGPVISSRPLSWQGSEIVPS